MKAIKSYKHRDTVPLKLVCSQIKQMSLTLLCEVINCKLKLYSKKKK